MDLDDLMIAWCCLIDSGLQAIQHDRRLRRQRRLGASRRPCASRDCLWRGRTKQPLRHYGCSGSRDSLPA